MVNFTTRQGFFLYSFDMDKEEKEKLDFLLDLFDKSNLYDVIKNSLTKENYQGRIRTNPYNMMATILYAFMIDGGRLREIERSCKISLDYMYLMDGETTSYVTFSTFINEIIIPNIYDIFGNINKTMISEMNLDIQDVFIDGSKFEANANKYKFVWKPNKKYETLKNKVAILLDKYNIKPQKITASTISEAITRLKGISLENGIDLSNIVRGKGRKLNSTQRDYIDLQDYLIKLLKYEEQIKICGDNRNSYYKTDFDATAMCLKEDYYSGLGSNMHAAYNVQFIVAKGIILGVYVCQDRNDYLTLKPCVEQYRNFYGSYPTNACADAGYGSCDNYDYIKEKSIGNYIKYPSWESERNGSAPQLFRLVNDDIICLNNKIGEKIEIENRHPKSKDASFYKFNGCRKCAYKTICKKRLKKKTDSFRIAEINPKYVQHIQNVRTNLLSPKGIELRVNRSIQVEGDFGNMKQNLSYSRFRRRGISKVTAEMILMAIGLNLRKYLRFKQTGTIPKFWIAPDDLKPKELPKVKIPKSDNKKQKSKNKETRDSYKYKKRAAKL